MNWLGNKLGFKDMNDWYQITPEIIESNDGGGLLRLLNGSPSKLIMSIYVITFLR